MSIEKPLKFSVVIPLYNKQITIQRAIQSVISQTYKDFELIVVDDGSTDQSFESACGIADPRIRIIRQENRGECAARNRGIKETRFEWIAFLDADDEWKNDFLKDILDLMQRFPSCGVYATFYEMVFGVNKKPMSYFKYYPPMWSGEIDNIFDVMCTGYPFNSSSIVIKKEYIIKAGGFPEGIHNAGDLITWIRLAVITKIAYLNNPLSIYYLKTGGKLNNPHQHLGRSILNKMIIEFIISGQIREFQERSARNLISKFQYEDTRVQLKSGNRRKAFSLWLKSKKAKYIWKEWLILLIYIIFPKRTLDYIFKVKKSTQKIV